MNSADLAKLETFAGRVIVAAGVLALAVLSWIMI